MKFNSKSVTIPWFQVGQPEVDLAETIVAVRAALKAQS